jgi:hypothetical protein
MSLLSLMSIFSLANVSTALTLLENLFILTLQKSSTNLILFLKSVLVSLITSNASSRLAVINIPYLLLYY